MKKSTYVEMTLTSKIYENTDKITSITAENVQLKKENIELREQLSCIETQQLRNNIVINGVEETKWEPYEVTKMRVYETIASILPIGDLKSTMDEARKADLVCCSRIGRYQMNRARPISVTLSKYDDKETIMKNKNNLLEGIYINDEYPTEVRRNRNKLRPILRLTKSLPHYREKCKMSGDKLSINRVSYTVNDLNKLPPDLAPYLVAQKENAEYIAFHGEHSPWSNFHPSPFVLNSQQYHSAEQWIQFQKVMLFGDSHTANLILQCSTPQECKRLSHYIRGIDHEKWRNEGFNLCLDRLRAKFIQNKDLIAMLKTTEPKLLVEVRNDKLCGTGIPLKDSHALNDKRWSSKGWLSNMLTIIRDEY